MILQLQIEINEQKMRAFPADQSSDFSKYFHTQDKSSLYNYSSSYNNQTLLLETTQIQQKNQPQISRQPNILQENEHNKSQSLFDDLYEQLEATIERSELVYSQEELKQEGANDLYGMCRHLIQTLKKLETKVEKIEQNDTKIKYNQKEAPWIDSQREIESILTYSSLKSSKGSKGCKCQSQKNSNAFMNNLFEYVEYKSKLQIYKDENDHLKKQVIQLEVTNEEMKKYIKKIEGENLKIKQLLKQYQNLNKKQIVKNQSWKHLIAQEQKNRGSHIRSNTFENQICSPSWKHDHQKFQQKIVLQNKEEKQNTKHMLECKIIEEQMRDYYKQSPMTPNPLLRTIKNTQSTENKNANEQEYKSKDRMDRLNQRVEKLLDTDNQKTQAKSKQRRAFPLKQRNLRFTSINQGVASKARQHYPFNGLLEQQNYQIDDHHAKQHILEHIQTMTTLPENPTFNELKRMKSARTHYYSPQRMSPLYIHQKNAQIK